MFAVSLSIPYLQKKRPGNFKKIMNAETKVKIKRKLLERKIVRKNLIICIVGAHVHT